MCFDIAEYLAGREYFYDSVNLTRRVKKALLPGFVSLKLSSLQVLLAMRANVEDRGMKGDCTPLMEVIFLFHLNLPKILPQFHNLPQFILNSASISYSAPISPNSTSISTKFWSSNHICARLSRSCLVCLVVFTAHATLKYALLPSNPLKYAYMRLLEIPVSCFNDRQLNRV